MQENQEIKEEVHNLKEKMETLQDLRDKEVLIKEQKTEIYNLKGQMETLSRDLKGVARILDVIHNITELNDEEANISAFNNINRLISDIASSLEASANDENVYIGS